MTPRNVPAVTGSFDGGEKRKPGRIRNVTVRPPSERVGKPAATSGTSRAPAAPEASAKLKSFAQVAYWNCTCHGLKAVCVAAGSVDVAPR